MIINQITIGCTDYDASVAFYRKLGMTQIVDSPPRYARFESKNGAGATLSLHGVDEGSGQNAVVYFDHETAIMLDAHVMKLKAEGLSFESGPADQSWGWREARLKDPAGNEICLMFAGDVRRFPAWRVDGRSS